MPSKKVLIIVPQLWTGGVQRMNVEIAAHIRDPRVKVTLLSLYPRGGHLLEKQADDYGLDVRYLDKRSGADPRIIGRLYAFMKEFKPDVIHINQRMMTYALIPMLLLRIPVRLYAVHNLAQMDAKGLARLVNRVAFHFFKVRPIAISGLCKASVVKLYGLTDAQVACVYNGVNTARFARTKPYRASEDGGCVFVTAGAFRKQKNYPLLVSAFAEVVREFPRARLVILGDGDRRAEIKARIRECGISDSVRLPGYVSDIPAELHRADAYVLSSDWEGLPVAVLEAMAAGLPIVSTRAGGVEDVVTDGVNGILTEIGDRAALASAMKKLAQDPALRERFARKSEELSGRYGIDGCAARYVRLYLQEFNEG
jgi:glycosyltransferase involved in cell wall biosynthesis